MTYKKFRDIYKGGYELTAAVDVLGFYKKGQSIYGNCDDMIVDSWLYNPLNGIYSVRLKNESC